MIDDKKIEAAKEEIYEDRFLLNGEEVVFDNDDKEEMFYEGDIKEAIGLGAKWAVDELLKDLWYPNTEEPDVRHKTIICLYKDGEICQDYDAYDEATEGDKLGRDEFNWDYYAEDNEIKKWCYATDLFPKKGGEQ